MIAMVLLTLWTISCDTEDIAMPMEEVVEYCHDSITVDTAFYEVGGVPFYVPTTFRPNIEGTGEQFYVRIDTSENCDIYGVLYYNHIHDVSPTSYFDYYAQFTESDGTIVGAWDGVYVFKNEDGYEVPHVLDGPFRYRFSVGCNGEGKIIRGWACASPK